MKLLVFNSSDRPGRHHACSRKTCVTHSHIPCESGIFRTRLTARIMGFTRLPRAQTQPPPHIANMQIYHIYLDRFANSNVRAQHTYAPSATTTTASAEKKTLSHIAVPRISQTHARAAHAHTQNKQHQMLEPVAPRGNGDVVAPAQQRHTCASADDCACVYTFSRGSLTTKRRRLACRPDTLGPKPQPQPNGSLKTTPQLMTSMRAQQ